MAVFGYLQKSQPPLVQHERLWQPFQSPHPLSTSAKHYLNQKRGITAPVLIFQLNDDRLIALFVFIQLQIGHKRLENKGRMLFKVIRRLNLNRIIRLRQIRFEAYGTANHKTTETQIIF